MPLKITFKKIIALTLISTLGEIVLANNKNNVKSGESIAPEASVVESKLPFREIPYLSNAFIDTYPENKGDAISVGELGVQAGDKDKILKLAQEIAKQQHHKFDSLLISYKGTLLFESYYLRGRINLPHYQASATKAYVSLAIGRAIQMGYLTMDDLHKPIISFLKELNRKQLVDGAERVTLHQALSMSSGIRLSREQVEEFRKNTPHKLKGQGQAQMYLTHSATITAESQSFLYGRIDPHIVMQVLNAVIPGGAKNFIKTELLDKLGITNYFWQTGDSGLYEAPYGSSLTSRDMLKWGILMMNRGKWNGEQLVPKAFLEKALKRIVQMGEDDIFFTNDSVTKPGYGYYFWQADLKVGNKLYSSVSAQGGGGQYIILVDELNLIIVSTGHDRELRPLKVAAERILPAFIDAK